MKRHLITVTLILMGYAIKLTAMPVMKWDHGIGAEVKQPTIPKLVGTIEEGKGLPKEALSVEAWVRIEKPTRWGGILSAIQDNGSYERGWLLGYENQQFCFALATEKRIVLPTSKIRKATLQVYGTMSSEPMMERPSVFMSTANPKQLPAHSPAQSCTHQNFHFHSVRIGTIMKTIH